MGRCHRNLLIDPAHYATAQLRTGPPVTYAAAQRTLHGYDYVIVGAGAAGCVLASKLSEDKNVSVLLLEAGGDNTKVLEAKVPLMFPKLFHTQHDWDYYTVEQPQLSSRRLYWPRGRIMGGSTSLNAMMYHHRAQSDFEQWASVHGCEGWGYDDLATYLRRMEKFTPNPARPPMDVQTHGSSGDWQTGYSWLSEIIEKGFIPACHDAGILANTDVNTREGTLGVVPFQTFIDQKGQRSSLATAFLTPDVLERDNLFVAYHAHVIRVLFDCLTSADPTAIGVEFQTSRGGSLFQVHARREVILCGGAINTAQVLMLSGIGPGNDLMSLGIPVIQKNEAVGRNLKDHLYPTPIICKAKPDKNLDYLSNNVRALLALLQWKLLGRGPLTSNAGEAAAFIRSLDFQFAKSSSGPPKDNTSGPMGPDLEIIGVPLAFNHHSEELVADGSSVLSIVLTHLRPLSVGTISLRSRDASDPRRTACLLADHAKSGFSILFEPVEVNDDPSSYWWPYSSSDIENISDDDLTRFLKEKAFTLYHPVGSARMGPTSATSVVDLECRVHGVKGPRIMDASIFPEQLSGHPTAPIAAMAFKLSDMIRQGRPTNTSFPANL